ncbi:hypothetical protein LGT41_0000695 [Abyssibius alkaniclasticus]|nr:hypothetical protein [Abyssibius alkaniclasticus]UPH71363.1 hypothetical protein LGT41_0000695 [Abyssibius alkaniclasticus]|tara:strand:- start:1396 stop:1539 length:144 start_codon:yes stop_codon:yes gene_type:complete
MSRKTTPTPPKAPAPQQSAAAAYLDLWEANITLFAREDVPSTADRPK